MAPAFSPGPWITHGAFVGSGRRWIFEDLYEQCSFHIAEKMPSSGMDGSRPMSARMRWYSSAVSPRAATSGELLFARFVDLRGFGFAAAGQVPGPDGRGVTLRSGRAGGRP